MVASQFSKFNDNLEIAYTSNRFIYTDKWPLARVNVTFRYQSEVTRALLDWCNVAVFFKGGSGTLAELFHAIDSKKNKEHSKPIIILNIAHQWDDLLNILEPLNLGHLYNVVDTPQKEIEYIENNIKIDSLSHTVIYKPLDYDYDR